MKPKRIPSNKRLPSDERPPKRPKCTFQRQASDPSHTQPNLASPPPTSYFTLPHRKSQKVAKTASFHFSSPFSTSKERRANSTASEHTKPVGPVKNVQNSLVKRENSLTSKLRESVKRENSLTSKLQESSMGIHKLIFNRLNDGEESETSAVKKCAKCCKGWSFWEMLWFDNFFLQWTLNLFSINQGSEMVWRKWDSLPLVLKWRLEPDIMQVPCFQKEVLYKAFWRLWIIPILS